MASAPLTVMVIRLLLLCDASHPLRCIHSKGTFETLDSKPSKDVIPTPASYQDAKSCSQEEELSRLIAEISMLEGDPHPRQSSVAMKLS